MQGISSLPFLPAMPLNRWAKSETGRNFDLNNYPPPEEFNMEMWHAMRSRIYELEHSLVYQANKPSTPTQRKTSPSNPSLRTFDIQRIILEALNRVEQDEPLNQSTPLVRFPCQLYLTPLQWIEVFENHGAIVKSTIDEHTRRLECNTDTTHSILGLHDIIIPIKVKQGDDIVIQEGKVSKLEAFYDTELEMAGLTFVFTQNNEIGYT